MIAISIREIVYQPNEMKLQWQCHVWFKKKFHEVETRRAGPQKFLHRVFAAAAHDCNR